MYHFHPLSINLFIKKLLISLLSLFCFFFCKSQNATLNSLDTFSRFLIKEITLKDREKIQLIPNKFFYRQGEFIWIKALTLKAISLKESFTNENIYIDLINNEDSLVAYKILNTNRRPIGSHFEIPKYQKPGFYWIRAYTCTAKNNDTNLIAVQSICILPLGNKVPHISRKQMLDSSLNQLISLELYPEGQLIITGASSKVAFRITDANKNPIELNGFVKDNRDSIISQFRSDNYGLGYFEFYPTWYRKYNCHIIYNGKDLIYPLPGFNFYSGQLSIKKGNNRRLFLNILLEDSIYKKEFKTYIIGLSKDSLCFAAIGKANYELRIPEEKFPPGISTFYLLDSNFHLLSERSLYINKERIINAVLNKMEYGKREKVTLDMNFNNLVNTNDFVDLSISVIDSNESYTRSTTELINEYFDDKEALKTPDWTLSKLNDLNEDQLDILMMARSGTYQRLKRSKLYALCNDDSLLYIKGQVISSFNRKKIVTLLSNSLFPLIDTTTDDGHFVFPIVHQDSLQFVLQVNDLNGRIGNYDITLDTFNFPYLEKHLAKQFTYVVDTIDGGDQYFKNETVQFNLKKGDLDPVIVVTKPKRILNYDESLRISPFSKIITSDKFNKGGVNSLGNAMLTVPGIQIINGYVTIGGVSSTNGPNGNTEPIIIEDGQQVYPEAIPDIYKGGLVSGVLTYLNRLNPNDISFIEILTGPEAAAYGMRGGNGVILINTKRTVDLSNQSLGLKKYFTRGYNLDSPFLMPDYSDPKFRAGKFIDNRTTLFWKNLIATNEDKNLTFNFYTSDVSASFVVVITGITSNGEYFKKVLPFSVR